MSRRSPPAWFASTPASPVTRAFQSEIKMFNTMKPVMDEHITWFVYYKDSDLLDLLIYVSDRQFVVLPLLLEFSDIGFSAFDGPFHGSGHSILMIVSYTLNVRISWRRP